MKKVFDYRKLPKIGPDTPVFIKMNYFNNQYSPKYQ